MGLYLIRLTQEKIIARFLGMWISAPLKSYLTGTLLMISNGDLYAS